MGILPIGDLIGGRIGVPPGIILDCRIITVPARFAILESTVNDDVVLLGASIDRFTHASPDCLGH